MSDLWLDSIQALRDQIVKYIRLSVLDVSGVGHDGVRAEGPAELHRVFEGGQRLDPLLRVLDCEHREVGSMNRDGHAPGSGRLPKSGAPTLIPGEIGYEREFHRIVTTSEQ